MKPNPNWPYLAGLFDGEGCVHIADFIHPYEKPTRMQQVYRLDMHITTTSKVLADWLIKEVGGRYYCIDMSKQSKGRNWKDAYRWQCSGSKNKEIFFKGILPYLVIKPEQVKIALEYITLFGQVCPDKRKILSDKLRKLTRRGKSLETNTSNDSNESKIESELIGDNESDLVVTQES